MARLLLQANGQPLGEFAITAETTHIGREQLNHLRLADPLASRYHAEIHRRGCCYTLTDRQSTNGTRLNGVPLLAPTALADNDVVTIGETMLVFRLEASDSPAVILPHCFDANATLLDAGAPQPAE